MKKILQLVTSLTIISAVCAAILATVDAVTKDQIANIQRQSTVNAAKLVMLPSVKSVEKIEGFEGAFAGKTDDGKIISYAIVGSDMQGYGGKISLMVGFDGEASIITYKKLEASETPGLGTKLSSPEFKKQFRGMSTKNEIKVKNDGGTVEAITSATITSRAVCRAINNASATLQKVKAAK